MSDDQSVILALPGNSRTVTDLESYLLEKGLDVFWGYERIHGCPALRWRAFCFGEFSTLLCCIWLMGSVVLVGEELKGVGTGRSRITAQRQAAILATSNVFQLESGED